MADLPVKLNASEKLFKEESGAYYPYPSPLKTGYTAIYADVWLTSQRLLIQVPYTPVSKKTVEFPLSHITGVSVSDKTVRRPASLKTDTRRYDLFVIEFDNSGREYLHTADLNDWVLAIKDARKEAPELPYTTMPNLKPGVEASDSEVTSLFGRFAAVGIGGMILLFCGALAAMVVCFAGMSLVFMTNAR